jgi:hypothetical protein
MIPDSSFSQLDRLERAQLVHNFNFHMELQNGYDEKHRVPKLIFQSSLAQNSLDMPLVTTVPKANPTEDIPTIKPSATSNIIIMSCRNQEKVIISNPKTHSPIFIWLVLWNMNYYYSIRLRIIIIPTDEHICFRGVETTNQ